MIHLLDTNVISEARKPRPDPGVLVWLTEVDDRSLRLSVLVLGELRRGVEKLRGLETERADVLDAWLTELHARFTHRIAPLTSEIAEVWGRLTASRPMPVVDSLLAATALVHDWTLVSRNEKHLGRTGVRLLNPFSGS